jgi:hypothetical protein
MRRVHLASWGTEEDLAKERDQYKQLVESMKLANETLDERANGLSAEVEKWKRTADELNRQHDEEKKNLEARIQILEDRVAQSQIRQSLGSQKPLPYTPRTSHTPQTPHASLTPPLPMQDMEAILSPRPGKRRRTSNADEYPPIPTKTPKTPKGKSTKWKGKETENSAQPPTPPARTRNTPSKFSGFRFGFRAPSTSLLALRGPQKRDFSFTGDRF